MNEISHLPVDNTARYEEANLNKIEAEVRQVKLVNGMWFLAYFLLAACLPAIVIGAWRWAL